MNILKFTLGIILASGTIISSCDNKNKNASHDHGNHHNENHPVSVEDRSTTGIAEINFDNLEFDFGTINEGDVVSHTYYFTNTGDVPLIIQNASPSCGCTVPNWSRDPIPPGGSGQIDVSFDSNGKTDTQNRSVSIVANTEPSITYLRIKGMVIPKATQALGPVRKN